MITQEKRLKRQKWGQGGVRERSGRQTQEGSRHGMVRQTNGGGTGRKGAWDE